MKDIKNIEITAWSIALVLGMGSLALTLSKDIPSYKEEVSKTDKVETKINKTKYYKEIEFISTPMEEYRKFDSEAAINVYLYQVKDQETNKWITLDIMCKKEYDNPPELLKEGRIILVGKYYDDDKFIDVYQLEEKYSSDDWKQTDNYAITDYDAPMPTDYERLVYLGSKKY